MEGDAIRIISDKEGLCMAPSLAGADGSEDSTDFDFSLVWNKITPFEMATIAWRLVWNRLPTRDNLLRQKVITCE